MKILLPIDGSKHSRAAVDFVASRTTLIGTDPLVEVLHAQTSIPARAARAIGKAFVRSYHEEEAGKLVNPVLAQLARAGLEAEAHTAVGHPAEEIAAAADKLRCDLIVMGSRGQTDLKEMLVGSVTHAVMARTRVPLLLIRSKQAPESDSLAVGIAVDGSRYGREAVKYVLRHGELFGARPSLTLIHVAPDFAGSVMPDMAGLALPAFSEAELLALRRKSFEAAVAPARKLMAKAGVPAAEVCLVGNPGDELASYARKRKLDVLVMGSHGHGAFHAVILGSVARRTAAHCEVPLLLVRKG